MGCVLVYSVTWTQTALVNPAETLRCEFAPLEYFWGQENVIFVIRENNYQNLQLLANANVSQMKLDGCQTALFVFSWFQGFPTSGEFLLFLHTEHWGGKTPPPGQSESSLAWLQATRGGWGSHSWINLSSPLKTQVSKPTGDLWPHLNKLLKPLLKPPKADHQEGAGKMARWRERVAQQGHS